MHTPDDRIINGIAEFYRHSSGMNYMPAEKAEQIFFQVRSVLTLNEPLPGFTAVDVLRIALQVLERQVVEESH